MSGKQNADSGCFSGILRRLLCQGSLQTHPSDQIPELNRGVFDEPKKEPASCQVRIQASNNPGVVARLMGLESLPESKWVPAGKSPDSVTRSRSVNFMDYLLKFDPSQAQHRRVRTSVSFREVPTASLNQQNNDLFVLYLDGVDKRESRARKSGAEFGDMKQKKEEKKIKKNTRERLVVTKKEKQEKNKRVSKFIDEPRRVSVKKHSKRNNYKGASDMGIVLTGKKPVNTESGATSKKRTVKPIPQKGALSRQNVTEKIDQQLEAAECSSENSSPVSVLDANDFSFYDLHDTCSEKSPRYMDLSPKWKSSVKDMDSGNQSPKPISILGNNDVGPRLIKKKDHRSMDSENTDYYIELAAKLYRFTEEAIMQSNWMPKGVLRFEDFEEICMEFGEHILAVLLQQVVEEVAGVNVENSAF